MLFFLISQQNVESRSVVSAVTPFNIYHDSNIQEVVKVKPILEHFMARVQEVLVEWPQHPNLLQVNRLCLFCICESWYVVNLVCVSKQK